MEREELTAGQIRERHKAEAEELHWRLSVNGGQIPGDLLVSILPWPLELIDEGAKAKTYLYRPNPNTTKYFLVSKE